MRGRYGWRGAGAGFGALRFGGVVRLARDSGIARSWSLVKFTIATWRSKRS